MTCPHVSYNLFCCDNNYNYFNGVYVQQALRTPLCCEKTIHILKITHMGDIFFQAIKATISKMLLHERRSAVSKAEDQGCISNRQCTLIKFYQENIEMEAR